MRWWGWVLIGAVVSGLIIGLLALNATAKYREDLGQARQASATADSTRLVREGERDSLRRIAAILTQGASQNAAAIAQATAAAQSARAREAEAKRLLGAARTAADSVPILVVALASAGRAQLEDSVTISGLRESFAGQVAANGSLIESNAKADTTIRDLTADRDRWKELANDRPATAGGKLFGFLPKPRFSIVAGPSYCPTNNLCVTAGIGF